MSPLHRLAFPLAALTAVGMLASDLYLPALPVMGRDLGASVTAGQATMAVFMIALAASQLLWGWCADRHGDRRTIVFGTALLCGGSVVCALAAGIDTMLAGRLLQGLGAGAATVAVPALIRRRFSETDAVGAMACVAIAESAIPAIGPVIGAAIVLYGHWRHTFWIIAALALLLAPLVSRIVGSDPATHNAATATPPALLRNGAFMRHVLSYALMFGALLMFVSSAPQLVTHWLGMDIRAFALLQILGVGAFMVGATRGAALVKRHGVGTMLRAGMLMQLAAGALMIALAVHNEGGSGGAHAALATLAWLVAAWALFCAGLGVRGPATMSRALSLAHEHAGKAAGLLMFCAFALCAAATLGVAPFLKHGLLPVAVLLTAMAALSAALLPEAFRKN